jgi:hypothetical protein
MTSTSDDAARMAQKLVADGKGILAADETVPTRTRRFETLGIKVDTRAKPLAGPRAPASGAGGLARARREPESRPSGDPPTGPLQQRCQPREVYR